jgi:hypothetical protein
MPIEYRVLLKIYPAQILQKPIGSVEKKANQIQKMS